MPKIISAFNGDSSLGDTIAKLGASMFGDQTSNALNSEKLYALQRQNTETDNLAERLAAMAGAQNLGADPTAQAMILSSGYDPSNFAQLGRMGAATEYGAADPRTDNWRAAAGDPYSATAAAFNSNLAETTRNNNVQSADRRYGDNLDAQTKKWLNDNASAESQAKLAEDTRYHNVQSADARYKAGLTNRASIYNIDQTQQTARMKPLAVYDPATKQTVFAPTNDLTGMQPIVSEADRKGVLLDQNFNNLPALNANQRQVLGANPTEAGRGTPKNYILPNGATAITYDGITDAATGARLPSGGYIGTVQGGANDVLTNPIKTALQGDLISNQKFNFIADQGIQLAQSDPTLFGPVGYARSLGQELVQGAKGVATLFQKNGEGAQALDEARAELAATGLENVLPELYDPNLSKVEALWGIMVYQGAAALAGQSGRGISDKDVTTMRHILGSPQSLFESAESMKSKLDTAKEVVSGFDKISRGALGDNSIVPVDPATLPQSTVRQPALQPEQQQQVDPAAVKQTPTGTTWRVIKR